MSGGAISFTQCSARPSEPQTEVGQVMLSRTPRHQNHTDRSGSGSAISYTKCSARPSEPQNAVGQVIQVLTPGVYYDL